MSSHVDVVIVGGGIAGLAATHRLNKAKPALSLCLIERDSQLGGKITTERVDGFVIEGGPDCFLGMKPSGVELCRQLNLENSLRGTDPANRRSFIRRKGKLNELPAGLTGLVPSRIGPLLTTRTLSWLGRARSALELFVPPRRDGLDETIAEFTERRFGREAYDWLVEPLMAGIHAGDGADLSLAATFPQLAQLERDNGSILKAMLKTRGPQRSTNKASAFLTPEGGLSEIVDALVEDLAEVNVRRRTTALSVSRSGNGYSVELADGSLIASRALVLATPAFDTSSLVKGIAPELALALSKIPFVSTAIVTMAFEDSQLSRPLDGSGYVLPRAEGGPIVACSWTSSKFKHRAPVGSALLRFFIGRAGQDGIANEPPETLLAVARREAESTLGIKGEPVLQRVARWPSALPQYNRGHLDLIERIETEVASLHGVELAGASYRGVGIPDCIQSGWLAADKIAEVFG